MGVLYLERYSTMDRSTMDPQCGSEWHKRVAITSITQYKMLAKKGKPLHGEWTPMAAILQSEGKGKT